MAFVRLSYGSGGLDTIAVVMLEWTGLKLVAKNQIKGTEDASGDSWTAKLWAHRLFSVVI
jgi:hypothetical protein